MSKIIKGYTSLQTANYTKVGTGTVANQCNSVYMVKASNAGAFNSCLLVKSTPSTPFSVVYHMINYGTPTAYQGYGPCWRQSSDGKISSYTIYTAGGLGVVNFLRTCKWTNETTYSASYTTDLYDPLYDPQWFKLEDNGTNRIFYMSTDGINWVQYHSIGRTDYLTANQVGFMIDPFNQACALLVDSFKIDYSG